MPPKHKTEQERIQMRHRILDAARDLFVKKGVDAVTMREIAKKVDYSPTSIYLHFKDKESLIQELCVTDFKNLGAELNVILQIAEPVERMMALGSAYAKFALSYPNHYRMMFMTVRPSYSLEEKNIEPSLDAYQLLNFVVSEVFNSKLFLPELTNPTLIAQTIWAAIHGVCSLQISMANDAHIAWCDIHERIAFMKNTIQRGLLREHNT